MWNFRSFDLTSNADSIIDLAKLVIPA